MLETMRFARDRTRARSGVCGAGRVVLPPCALVFFYHHVRGWRLFRAYEGSNESPSRPPGPAVTRAPPPRPIFAPAPRASETRETHSPQSANPRYAPRCVRCSSVESPTFSGCPPLGQCSDESPAAERGVRRAQVSASPNRPSSRAVALCAIPLLGGFATASP